MRHTASNWGSSLLSSVSSHLGLKARTDESSTILAANSALKGDDGSISSISSEKSAQCDQEIDNKKLLLLGPSASKVQSEDERKKALFLGIKKKK
jgi:hypothetical protein